MLPPIDRVQAQGQCGVPRTRNALPSRSRRAREIIRDRAKYFTAGESAQKNEAVLFLSRGCATLVEVVVFVDLAATTLTLERFVEHEQFTEIRHELETIQGEMLDAEQRVLTNADGIPDGRRTSARNLVHYLALRRRDLRLLQWQLASAGLSSLGRAESRALANLQAVLDVVHRLMGHDSSRTGLR
jgi:hypothetical protein